MSLSTFLWNETPANLGQRWVNFLDSRLKGDRGKALVVSTSGCLPSSCLGRPQTRITEDQRLVLCNLFEPVHTCLIHTRRSVYSFEISLGNNCIALSGSGQEAVALLLQHVLDLYFPNILLGDVQ